MTDAMIFFSTILGFVTGCGLIGLALTRERPFGYFALAAIILWGWAYTIFGA